jgi:hypothetical protein
MGVLALGLRKRFETPLRSGMLAGAADFCRAGASIGDKMDTGLRKLFGK